MVRARRQRGHPGADRHGGPARRAPAGEIHRKRVAGGAEEWVHGVGADGKLGDVGLADHDATSRTDSRHDAGIGVGHVVGVTGTAVGGAQIGGGLKILDGDGYPVQRTHGRRGIGGSRCGESLLSSAGDHGVDRRIDGFDAIEA